MRLTPSVPSASPSSSRARLQFYRVRLVLDVRVFTAAAGPTRSRFLFLFPSVSYVCSVMPSSIVHATERIFVRTRGTRYWYDSNAFCSLSLVCRVSHFLTPYVISAGTLVLKTQNTESHTESHTESQKIALLSFDEFLDETRGQINNGNSYSPVYVYVVHQNPNVPFESYSQPIISMTHTQRMKPRV
jgi:hypothetical protein